MNVLLITEKYCDLCPELGITSGHSHLHDSLQASGLATIHEFCYDEYLFNNLHSVDEVILEHCKTHDIDVAICSYYPYEKDPRNIRKDTLAQIPLLGIPLVIVWFDFICPFIRDTALKMASLANLSVVVDTDAPYSKFLSLWVPQDPQVFHNPHNLRDINVSFVGTTHGYHDRVPYLDFVKPYISGGQREHKLTLPDYASILQRSKISLNFSGKHSEGQFFRQTKARIYETMLCGSLLFEQEPSPITRWYEPMVHYVPFGSKEDLRDKIAYYLSHEDERLRIAKTGQEKTETCYNATEWWKQIFAHPAVV